MIFGADPQVALLLLAALGALLCAWFLQSRQSRQHRAMAKWLALRQPKAWNALPWIGRELLIVWAIARLQRDGLAADPEFEQMRREAQRYGRQSLLCLFLASVLLGMTILGVQLWGWRI